MHNLLIHRSDVMSRSTTPVPWENQIQHNHDPCCLCYDDDDDTLRTRMRCNHVFCTQCLQRIAEDIIKRDEYKFPCPMPCGKVWKDFEVKEAAYPNVDDQTEFQMKVEKNYAMTKLNKIKPCPGCKTFCFRPEELRNKDIMRCPRCTNRNGKGFDFCWYCEGLTDGSITKCDKTGCNGLESVLKSLRDCPKVTIWGVENCPSVRACPLCGNMIRHDGACKHMGCDKCKREFCFVCLKVRADDRTWQCGSYSTLCIPAPTQQYIPGYI